jgi:hypothetical protein
MPQINTPTEELQPTTKNRVPTPRNDLLCYSTVSRYEKL